MERAKKIVIISLMFENNRQMASNGAIYDGQWRWDVDECGKTIVY